MPAKHIFLSFSPDNSILKEYISTKNITEKDILVIDITNFLTVSQKLKSLKAYDFDTDFSILKKTHLKVAAVVATLSKKVAPFSIKGLNLFWQTNLSEKTDFFSIGSKIIYFETVLDHSIKLKKIVEEAKHIHIIHPPNSSLYAYRLVKKYINKINTRVTVSSNILIYQNLKLKLGLGYYFIKLIKYYFGVLKFKANKNFTNYNFKPIVFLKPTKSNDKIKPEHKILECIKNHSEFLNLRQIISEKKLNQEKYNVERAIDKYASQFLPTKKDVFSITLKVVYIQFLHIVYKLNPSDKKQSLLLKMALFEISNASYELNDLMLHVWYKNLFTHIPKKTVFLITDEFYKSGRLICAAKIASKNKKIKVVGIQHGMIGETHALYKITDTMISGPNALPIPDNFIVWGSFFKNFFHQFNSLRKSYTPIASFLKPRAVSFCKHTNSKKRILWCTTLPELSLFDLELLNTIEDIDNYEIILREHPNYEIMTFVKNNVSIKHPILKKIIRKNDNTIREAITLADIVLAQNPSTIIMDSLLSQTPVLYTDPGVRICDFKDNYKAGIFIIKDKNDFKEKFPLAISQKGLLDKEAMSVFINNQTSIVEVLNSILKSK